MRNSRQEAPPGNLEFRESVNFKTNQKKYRVYREDGARGREPEAWRYYELHGKFGAIYPYNQETLGVQITGKVIAGQVRRLHKFEIIQDADDMTVFKAPNAPLHFFGKLLKLKIQTRLSPELREKLRNAMVTVRSHRLKPGKNGLKQPKNRIKEG